MAASGSLSTWPRGFLLVESVCVLKIIFTAGHSAALEEGPESTQSASHHGYQSREANCEPRYARRGVATFRSRHIQSPATFHESYSEAWRSIFKNAAGYGDSDAVIVVSRDGTGAQCSIIQDALDHQVPDNNSRTSICITLSGERFDDEKPGVLFPTATMPCCSRSGTTDTAGSSISLDHSRRSYVRMAVMVPRTSMAYNSPSRTSITFGTNTALDFRRSYVRVAQTTNVKGVDTMLSICCKRALNSSRMKQFTSLNPSTLSQHFFATMDGTWRVLPDSARSGADRRSFERRGQPWFRTAKAVVKVVVVLIDLAASMDNNLPPDIGGGTYLEAAINMISSEMLLTLSAGDDVNIILFDSMTTSAVLVQDYNTTEQVELDPLRLELSVQTVETQCKQSDLSDAMHPAMPNFDSKSQAACTVILLKTDGMFATLGNATLLSANLTVVKLLLYKLRWPDDPDPFVSAGNNSLTRQICAVGSHFEPILKNLENPLLPLHKLFSYLVNLKRTLTGGRPQYSFVYQVVEQIGGNSGVVAKPAFSGDDFGGVAGVAIYMDLLRSLSDAVDQALKRKMTRFRASTAHVVLAALLQIAERNYISTVWRKQ